VVLNGSTGLAEKRFLASLKRRRLERTLPALKRTLERTGQSPLQVLFNASEVLAWPTIEQKIAVAYLRIKLVSRSPTIDADLRKSLKSLEQRAFRQLQQDNEIIGPRGRPLELSRIQEHDVYRVYQSLREFFRNPALRPDPADRNSKKLLARINAELSRLVTPRSLTLDELERLTEEIAPNKIAKVAVGVVYRVSPAQVDKVVSRVGSTLRSPRQ
jgi:hypothetical protein